MKESANELVIASPGRINLIGEHTDYNMGLVLPAAIDKKITFKFLKNGSEYDCRIHSEGLNKRFSLDLRKILRSEMGWENYILGVLYEITKRTNKLKGFDCRIDSTLPIGSGVSSSAALECGLAFGLNQLFDLGFTRKEIIALSRTAEHNFVGTQCGIMDQFSSVMGKEGNAILLDCRTLHYSYIPLNLKPYKIILLNSNVSHNLASSEYNTRKIECEKGVTILQQNKPEISSLRDASITILEACKSTMSSTVYNRCKYIIEENNRVLNVVEALKKGDLKQFGKLLYEGHKGLSELYEIGCSETDFLVNFSKEVPAVLGARQMGGGFGGCTINIVHEDGLKAYISNISAAYKKKFDIELTSFEGHPSNGTAVL